MVFSTVKLFFIILLACEHPKVLLHEADLMSPPSAQSHSPLCIATLKRQDGIGQKKATSHSLNINRGTQKETEKELGAGQPVQYLSNRSH
jgi:hypothetical protein